MQGPASSLQPRSPAEGAGEWGPGPPQAGARSFPLPQWGRVHGERLGGGREPAVTCPPSARRSPTAEKPGGLSLG